MPEHQTPQKESSGHLGGESAPLGTQSMVPRPFELSAGPPDPPPIQRQEGVPPSGESTLPTGLVDPWDPEAVRESEIIDPWANEDAAALTARVQALLDANGGNGWHTALPSQADMHLEQVDGDPGRAGRRPRPRVEPSISGGPAAAAPATAAETAPESAPSVEDQARAAMLQQMRSRRSEVAIPTDTGRLAIYRGGYAYRAGSYAGNEQASGYTAYLRGLGIDDLGYNPISADHRRFWSTFRWIMQEGDPSAINAYDSEHITLGAGFSADTDTLIGGQVLNRLPAAYRNQLYSIGIHVEANGALTVLDLATGSVLHGQDALVTLQTDESRLGFLINAAQSTEQMDSDDGSQHLDQRTWMVRAQFETFIASNSAIPAAVFGWPQAHMRFAFKLRHWMGSLSWAGLAATGGDPSRLANYAFGRLSGRLRMTDAELQRKIRTIAGRDGIGIPASAIVFSSRAE